jgi:hypothetical protein
MNKTKAIYIATCMGIIRFCLVMTTGITAFDAVNPALGTAFGVIVSFISAMFVIHMTWNLEEEYAAYIKGATIGRINAG